MQLSGSFENNHYDVVGVVGTPGVPGAHVNPSRALWVGLAQIYSLFFIPTQFSACTLWPSSPE